MPLVKQQQKSVSSGLKWVWRLLSSTISIVGFFFLNSHSIIEAYSSWIIVLCFLVLIGCHFFRESELSKDIAIFAGFMLLFTLIGLFVSYKKEEDNTDNELLSDVTMFITEEFPSIVDNPDRGRWLPEAIKSGRVAYILVPPDTNMEADGYFDKSFGGIIDADSTMLHAFMMTINENETKVASRYNLLILSGPRFNERKKLDKRIGIILPGKGISAVLDGILEMNQGNWDAARCLFEKAESLGNAAGAYHLARWYKSGYGREPDKNSARESKNKMRMAAENGSREARVELGRMYLLDSVSTPLQRVDGEKYLRKAALVKTVATLNNISCSRRALDGLNDYLRAVKRFKEAYELTKDSYAELNDPYFRYVSHLDNCLSRKEYTEALDIIREGELEGFGYCYLVHAGLLTNGKGLKKDYAEAEKLLRYAADSLDYYPAYRGLADLYRKADVDGCEFWERLYEARYSNRVE